VPTKQVEISTRFIEVQTGSDNALGIDWSTANASFKAFNKGFSTATADLVRFARGNFEAQLGALMQTNRATLVNEPRVVTQNNQEAEFEFDTVIPYFTPNITYNNFGQQTVQYVETDATVDNMLDVTPRINADDSVTMDLYPEISDQIGSVAAPDNSTQVPIITTEYVETEVTVADGETVVIGGLMRKNETLTEKQTPLLSNIPIIGGLFRSKETVTSNSELLIFVTPRIVHQVPTQ